MCEKRTFVKALQITVWKARAFKGGNLLLNLLAKEAILIAWSLCKQLKRVTYLNKSLETKIVLAPRTSACESFLAAVCLILDFGI